MDELLPHHAVKVVSLPRILEMTMRSHDASKYNAHETTAVEAFAIALLCGDVRADVSLSHSINRINLNANIV